MLLLVEHCQTSKRASRTWCAEPLARAGNPAARLFGYGAQCRLCVGLAGGLELMV